MSSVVLLKDHEGQRKGATISVPFMKRKLLLGMGIARDPEAGAETSKPDPASEALKRIEKQYADALEAVRKDLAKVTTERDEALKQLAALKK